MCKQGFPTLYQHAESGEQREILMNFIGPTLKEIVTFHELDDFQLYSYILQILNRVEALHNLGFVHGDIKLQNMLVDAADQEKVFLIDFGLSERY